MKGLLAFLGVILMAFFTVAYAAEPTTSIPKLITFTSSQVGTGGYVLGGFLSDAIMQKYGIKVRQVPSGPEMPRVSQVRSGEADFFSVVAPTSFFAQEGIEEYASPDWGPQRVCMLWFASHPGVNLAVRGDSKIFRAADLKGKRFPVLPSRSLNLLQEIYLAFAGLTYKDVTTVNVGGITQAQRMVMEAKLDASHLNPSSGIAYEWESMPYGLRYIPLPEADKAGWERIQKLMPLHVPLKATLGAGLSKEKPLETVTYGYPALTTYDSYPIEKAYFITKAINETYEIYAPKDKQMEANFKLDTFLRLYEGTSIPLHAGTIKYLKEIGKWTSERETMNQDRLRHQQELKKLWDSVIGYATEKKLKGNELSNYWQEKKKSAGF